MRRPRVSRKKQLGGGKPKEDHAKFLHHTVSVRICFSREIVNREVQDEAFFAFSMDIKEPVRGYVKRND
jgi:hypothetical protein